MKQLITLLLILAINTPFASAYDGCNQRLTPEEFREEQKAFITDKAKLTTEEADKFFPVYFELQDKKKELNNHMWKLLSREKEKGKEMTDAQYEEIMLSLYDLKIKSDTMEKEYYAKFKKVLSPKKIYMVQRAETNFHRSLVKDVHQKGLMKRGGNNRK